MTIPKMGLLAVAILLSTTAGAGTLTTAFVVSNGLTARGVTCDVTNVSTRPITVTSVQLFDAAGDDVTFGSNRCPVPPATLAPHATCEAIKDPFSPGGYCTTTASGKFRLALNLLDNANNDTIETVEGAK
jgi:hypothetical protein